MPLIDLDAWDYNYEPPEWFLAHDHGKPIPLVKEEWEHKHDLEGELFKQEHPEMHNPKFISSNKNPNPRPDTGRIDIVEEYRRINGLPDGDQIMRWRDVGRSNPFGAPFAFDSRWDQLGTLVSLTAGCFHKSCLWDGLSETERDWLVSWVPKAEQWVNADKGWYMELWRAVIWRVLWEQLFSPDAPDDAWLGPDWQAFGTLHRSLKTFEEDAHTKDAYKHANEYYKSPKFTYCKLLYTRHGVHKDARVIKDKIKQALLPVIRNNSPEKMKEFEEHLTEAVDWAIITDLRIQSAAGIVLVDWCHPETGTSSGFNWVEGDKFIKRPGERHNLRKEYPVGLIGQPLVRMYGIGYLATRDGGEAFFPVVTNYDGLRLMIPMEVLLDPFVDQEESTDKIQPLMDDKGGDEDDEDDEDYEDDEDEEMDNEA